MSVLLISRMIWVHSDDLEQRIHLEPGCWSVVFSHLLASPIHEVV